MVEKTRFYVIAYAALGKGLSGGDNILIELSRRWADKLDITIKGGVQIYNAAIHKNLHTVMFDICPSYLKFGRYIERMFWALYNAFKFKGEGIVYTASDFWHDSLVGCIIKLRNPKILWIAGCYLVAPPIFASNSPYKGFSRLRGVIYSLSQKSILWAIKRYSDIVYVTSEPERRYFPNKKVIVVRGGVNIPKFTPIPWVDRRYDAIFMGRFHYQKGVIELIDIWYKVWHILPNATLIMVGNGALQKKCIKKIKKLKMEGFIYIEDFADDLRKDYLFRQSKVIVHPATYDSGGMSCAEGMVYGLPAVGFDLETYKTYYPKGMVKVKTITEFAEKIVGLAQNKEYYDYWSKEARDYIVNEWNWDKKAEQIWKESGF